MLKCCDILVLFVILYSCSIVICDVTLNGSKCGQLQCKRGEYCTIHRTCEPCGKICDSKNHNFDESICTKQCQDYIHDELYMLKDGSSGDENLKATVQKLSRMVTVTLSLVCFMLIVLAAVLCLQLYRWKKKNNITVATVKSKFFSKKSEASQNSSTAPATTENGTKKTELRLEMPTESTHSGNSPVTMTTSISRRPAEDSTLDYAYDNPAMASSPTNNKTNPNNSF